VEEDPVTDDQGGVATQPVGRVLDLRPATAISAARADRFDSLSFRVLPLLDAQPAALAQDVGVNPEAARLMIERASGDVPRAMAQLVRARPDLLADLLRLYGRTFPADEAPLHLVDVHPSEPVFADNPFVVNLQFQNANPQAAVVVLAAVTVRWAGESFVVEQELRSTEPDDDAAIAFDAERALPAGPAAFDVDIYREDGARASFRRTVYVLPAPEVRVRVGLPLAAVVPLWRDGDLVAVDLDMEVANGTAESVALDPGLSWQVVPVDAPAAPLDAGHVDLPDPPVVPPFSVWRGGARLGFPAGGAVHAAIGDGTEVGMIGAVAVAGEARITALTRIVPTRQFGINLVVLGELVEEEPDDLRVAVDRMRDDVYFAAGLALTGRTVEVLPLVKAGAFSVIDDRAEAKALFAARNGATVGFIDVFVAQKFTWPNVNGFTGQVDGPTVKGSDVDGCAVSKTGERRNGVKGLKVEKLRLLIGHELGHYLGELDTKEPGELMFESSGDRGVLTTPAQRTNMADHGLVRPV
jgi:hypothetical protein